MIEFDWTDRHAVAALPLPALWRSEDGATGRAYAQHAGPPPAGWTPLTSLRVLAGASAGVPPTAGLQRVHRNAWPEYLAVGHCNGYR